MAESLSTGKQVLSASDITRCLTRIAHEILERNGDLEDVVLLGIPSAGAPLAQRLADALYEVQSQNPDVISPRRVQAGTLDITMYRDDLGRHPIRVPAPTRIPQGRVEGRTIILVDDVLYSGRSIRAALDALSAIGRAERVQLAVLIDRGHRQLPIRADYVGKNLPTHKDETVVVSLTELGAAADSAELRPTRA
ncbi:MAG: bifunctional pyr operon transcriptional regulator/uracil phosphoribosyltransferase PyrR [Actinomyces graevenitzii]|uniref:Bifunctional protein PyrR n=2 Tax=Actinomyces graevenitzii TaxID=55565 RepID=A0A9E7AH48_9ACTO|nr:bifunctional pyr operon transcriptional regulator/uracil phosphoribosyltransferase PyrR [Actinomyces graevenitzii]ERH14911.1 putative pyrimidine operon regulatory protein/uracil phosphoribosyltransferase PyrR [Actinomyces graevenitzii F0530]MBF0933470.1 bifunctional pyr operon transcriptional regulator/uracil phosphoribosyltransferase PyrR [Actinomyces graevenitzii]MBS4942629.1 bifunctional pyr operon transcriptional regulator/uracil phosphoribosyltransferase PyrR [Actinomyces graevenitzii]U